MNFDIEAAIRYPFRKDHWQDTILFPGCVQYINTIVVLVILFLCHFVTGSTLTAATSPEYGRAMLLYYVVAFPISLVLNAFNPGFIWRLVDGFKSQGFQVKPPSWQQDWAGFFKDGVILSLYASLWLLPVFLDQIIRLVLLSFFQDLYLANAIPLTLIFGGLNILYYLALFFLMPFIITPIVMSSHERTLGAIMQFQEAWKLAKKRYWSIILSLLIWFLVYIVGYILFMCASCLTCCIGFLAAPFLMGPFTVIYAYLMIQAIYPPEEIAPPELQLPTL
ncbi:MAG: DUF4013 domain-containing protein [Cyanobacteria bacterium]|nr:DUF4013 domain-containing protein [Cyanobacteriota bacterium]